MKAKKLLGLALSAVMAVSAVAPWTGMTAFAHDGYNRLDDYELEWCWTEQLPCKDNHEKDMTRDEAWEIAGIPQSGDLYEKNGEYYTKVKGKYLPISGYDHYVTDDDDDDHDKDIDFHYAYRYQVSYALYGNAPKALKDLLPENESLAYNKDGVEYTLKDVSATEKEVDGKTWKFVGWVDAKGAPVTSPTTITSNTTFYAKWEVETTPPVDQVTVTFVVNPSEAAEAPASQTIEKGTTVDVPALKYDETEWEFLGWFDKDGKKADFSQTISANTTFTAEFEAKEVTPPQEDVDAILVVMSDGVKAMYEDLSWITAGRYTHVNNNKSIKGYYEMGMNLWNDNSYNCTLEDITGVSMGKNLHSASMNFLMDRDNGNFAKVEVSYTKTYNPADILQIGKQYNTLVLYCQLVSERDGETPDDCTVTYHANFGEDKTQSQLNKVGEAHTVLSYEQTQLPKNPGYVFRGWSTTKDGGVDYTSGSMIDSVDAAMDLYAVWEKSETTAYVVTHRFADGTPSGVTFADNNTVVTAGYTENYVVIPPQTITAGYTIDKIEVYKGERLFTTYTGNYSYMGSNVSDAPVTLVYYVSKVEETEEKYTVTHEFAAGTPDDVTFRNNQKVVTEKFAEQTVSPKSLTISDGYKIDSIEVFKQINGVKSPYSVEYFDGIQVYLSETESAVLVYHVSKVEKPVDPTDPTDPTDPILPEFPDIDDGDDGEEIEEPEVPLNPGPGGETSGETDEAILVDSPDGGNNEEIGDEDVPLVDGAPQTGVKVAGSLALLAGAAAIAAVTLKKRKDR